MPDDETILDVEAGAGEGEGDSTGRAEPAELIGTGTGVDAGSAATPPAPPALDPALTDRLSRLERSNAELNDMLYRMGRRDGGPAPAAEERPPVEKVETWDDMVKYLDWRDQKLANTLRSSVAQDTSAISSEQRARGLFNREAMGDGRDYDALVNRHIEPIERADPSFRKLLSSQRDPAAARYLLAGVLEMLDRFGNDPVKGMAAVWNAIDGKRTTTKQVVDRIKTASEKQVGRTNLRASASGDGGGKGLDAEGLLRLSTSDFLKRFPNAIS